MLLTGLLGQVGHDWAHGAAASHRAWTAAMEAEQAWLGGAGPADAGQESSVQIFAAGHAHSHGDSPDPQNDGLPIDHAHAVVFLMPSGAPTQMPGMSAAGTWPAQRRVPATASDSPERPPRTA